MRNAQEGGATLTPQKLCCGGGSTGRSLAPISHMRGAHESCDKPSCGAPYVEFHIARADGSNPGDRTYPADGAATAGSSSSGDGSGSAGSSRSGDGSSSASSSDAAGGRRR